ncbi:MAG: hypothetical protein R3175_01525 [Marinobacter sp.]|uniref:hypothetical protein n=1 Tax=Marinobacter sp. TaxID=50741 RepID=UPI00299F2A87|nr:hypothetical protein [Marinobacter sp.]MDX1754722.1 hypothetical protein [Marinobacter sp.]
MEPIRPDDDELRDKLSPKTPQKRAGKPKPPRAETGRGKPKVGDGAKSGVAVWLLGLLLLAGVALVGYGGYEQRQRIEVLESQLEEADYWARQSKLALARFEGALSETGESLEQTGASMEERLEAQAGRLDSVDEEVRKLWALANERNRHQLDEQKSRIEELETAIAGQRDTLTALQSEVAALGERFNADLAAMGERVDEQGGRISTRLDELAEQVGGVDDVVERRLQRFAQERSLADQEIRTRLQALERQTGRQATASELAQAQERLRELEQTVNSIDSSRSQFTARLVRLSDEIADLRQQMMAR